MALKLRRGTEAQRATTRFAMGELVWTTDTYRLYVGDGIENGGWSIAKNLPGAGMTFNASTGRLDVNFTGLNSDAVAEGNNNLFFTTERGIAAASVGLLDGNNYNEGIQFQYDDVNSRITASIDAGAGLPAQDGFGGKYLKTDGTTATWEDVIEMGITSVEADTAPALGGDLDLNTNNITGTGNINISGSVTASSLSTSGITFGNNTTITGGPVNHIGVVNSFLTNSPGASFVSLVTASSDNAIGPLTLAKARGTVFSPSAVQNNDPLAKIIASGFSNAFTPAGTITCSVAGTVSAGVVPSKWTVTVSDAAGATVTPLTIESTKVSFGVAPTVPVYANDSARDVAIVSPVAGMLVLNGTAFQGYNGTAWVVLG